MADPINASVGELAGGLGPFGSLLTTIFTMIGGIVGVYIIFMLLNYFEKKRFKKTLDRISGDLAAMRKSMQRIENLLSEPRK